MDRNRKAAPADQDDKPLGRDERVSVWPASFEEVVRKLHGTPPLHRRQDGPDGDHRDEG